MERDTTLYERIARLEQSEAARRDDLRELHDHLHRIEHRVEGLERDIERSKGAFGTLLFVGAAIITGLKMAWGWIRDHWS